MKVCPICEKTYKDENLNFCLDDGSTLTEYNVDDTPPTILMDSSRQTNPNFPPIAADYQKPSFDDYDQPQFGAPNQQIYQQPNVYPQPTNQFTGKDQTLPIISLGLGVAGFFLFCCYLGFPLGIGAIITGYIGMKRADDDPQSYSGKGLAIAGIVVGGISVLINIIMILAAVAGNL